MYANFLKIILFFKHISSEIKISYEFHTNNKLFCFLFKRWGFFVFLFLILEKERVRGGAEGEKERGNLRAPHGAQARGGFPSHDPGIVT